MSPHQKYPQYSHNIRFNPDEQKKKYTNDNRNEIYAGGKNSCKLTRITLKTKTPSLDDKKKNFFLKKSL